MSNTKKSVLSAAGVVSCVAFVVGGSVARRKTDLGVLEASRSNGSIDRLLASRSDDVNVPAGDYFYELSQKLKEQYVEPVSDEQKLATGAIRGMIGSLMDPQSLYMDKSQFQAFINARDGKFEGIGADFALITGRNGKQAEAAEPSPSPETSAEDAMAMLRDIPKLEVVSVVPGGPADKAGVQVGDITESVDGHWVANSAEIRRFRDAQKNFLAKKLSMAELNAQRNELRGKAEHAVMPLRAKDQLFIGKAGNVTVVWDRGGVKRTTKIQKAVSSIPAFSVQNGQIGLRFVPGVAEDLKKQIVGKTTVTINLRNNTMGDLASMKQCLEVLVPKGRYGSFVTFRHDTPTPLTVFKGNPSPPSITLVTDKSTRGVAEVFALALSSKGYASLSGSETGGDRDNRAIIKLPDGSGYTLVTSVYKPNLSGNAVAHKGGAR